MNDQDLSSELNEAVSELREALERAALAGARIQAALPRVSRISSVLEELESVFAAGRREVVSGSGIADAAASLGLPPTPINTGTNAAPLRRIGPTPPSESPPPTEWDIEPPVAPPATDATADAQELTAAAREPTTTFRLEFESRSGPLDLRAVDDAVSQHPSVQDVALLDYDGRRATLKVWVAATVSPAEVQESLSAHSTQIGNGNELSIVALEDVA